MGSEREEAAVNLDEVVDRGSAITRHLAHAVERLRHVNPVRVSGRVTDVIGLVIEGTGPGLPIGGVCHIERRDGGASCRRGGGLPAEPRPADAARRGERHRPGQPHRRGAAIARRRRRPGLLRSRARRARPPDRRRRPDRRRARSRRSTARTSIRSSGAPIRDAARPRRPRDRRAADRAAAGQRLGIFAGSGVGKSALLGMIARSTRADVNVIALIGERGREVREFIERDLGPEGLARSVVVVATSDQPALVRIQRRLPGDRDRRVLPRPGPRRAADDGLGDALRHGAARGRASRSASRRRRAATRRRCSPCCRGCSSAPAPAPRGTITGLYTVLVEGDDMNEPVADAVRVILDGHVVLSRGAGPPGPLPGDRRAAQRLAAHDRHRAGRRSWPHAAACASWLATYRGRRGPDQHRRLHRRQQRRASTRPSPRSTPSRPSCARA